MRDFPGLSGWALYTVTGPIYVRGRQKEKAAMHRGRDWSDVTRILVNHSSLLFRN